MGISQKKSLLFTGNVRHSIGTIIIQHNVIPGDWATDSLIDITSYQPVTVTKNYLRNLNSDVCVIRVPNFRESFEINATFNYWGKTVAMDIVDIVCGFEKDMDKSFVNYIPFYIDNNINQLVSATQDDFDVQRTFGGDITKNFTIPMLDEPIIISRSLFVRPGCVLTIPSGAILRFKENRGIYIQGTLKIATGISKFTILTSVNDTVFWNGIMLKSTSDEYSTLNNVQIVNTMTGFTAISNKFEMRRSQISNSRASCMTVKPDDYFVNTYDFEGTSISDCKENGILFTDDGIINVSNVNIKNASVCMKMDENYGYLTIKTSNITDCSTAAYVRFGLNSKFGNLTLDSCRITNSSNGLDFPCGIFGQ
ncbi:unnamed protein product [Mytilus coruscus]|uniref:Right handed beta helix domain-containing protein n=1 Tax=Mytilus coruscus TaxID=42192 RepID=A0A6J8EPT7_MYTCO|nr:unnamed protein product [Mytilus coruscus]